MLILINEKLRFLWLAKKDNLMLLNLAFSINLNAAHVTGMTHFNLTVYSDVRLLDPLA